MHVQREELRFAAAFFDELHMCIQKPYDERCMVKCVESDVLAETTNGFPSEMVKHVIVGALQVFEDSNILPDLNEDQVSEQDSKNEEAMEKKAHDVATDARRKIVSALRAKRSVALTNQAEGSVASSASSPPPSPVPNADGKKRTSKVADLYCFFSQLLIILRGLYYFRQSP